MSYRLGMFFQHVKSKEKALELAYVASEIYWKNIKDAIRSECMYCPSVRFGKEKSEADNYWVIAATLLNFTYWEEKKLFALTGENYPKAVRSLFAKNIVFQNSTDQDYELNKWANICPWMDNLREQTENLSESEVVTKCRVRFDIDCASDDIEYYRRWYLYKEIFDELRLDDWLYGNDNADFMRFSHSPITTTERAFAAQTILQKTKREISGVIFIL